MSIHVVTKQFQHRGFRFLQKNDLGRGKHAMGALLSITINIGKILIWL
jgi:hypothetical protein